jgi:hypothetical protein
LPEGAELARILVVLEAPLAGDVGRRLRTCGLRQGRAVDDDRGREQEDSHREAPVRHGA